VLNQTNEIRVRTGPIQIYEAPFPAQEFITKLIKVPGAGTGPMTSKGTGRPKGAP